MIANYGLNGEWSVSKGPWRRVTTAFQKAVVATRYLSAAEAVGNFSTEFLDEWLDLLTLVSTKWLNRLSASRFKNSVATVNTPDQNTPKPEETNDLKAQIDMLQAEKLKLEAELKSREEMMSNLLSFIQASK